MNLHLTRKDHDLLLNRGDDCLQHLFRGFPYNWSLSGVTFQHVTDAYANYVRERIAYLSNTSI